MKLKRIKIISTIFPKSIKKIIYLLILSYIFIFSINSSFAINCGGEVKCNCGDTITSNYILKENLICNNSGLNLGDSITLDCNDFQIKGSNKASGLRLSGSKNIVIKNCKIENFSIGIETKSKRVWKQGLLGGSYQVTVYPSNIQVIKNQFKFNEFGIKGLELQSIIIYNNIFQNNSKNSFYLNSNSATIYGNSFYKDNFFFTKTSHKTFCKNGITNLYFFKTEKIPQCNCIYPITNLNINSNINFCNGKYKNINNLKLLSNGRINCNGGIFSGENSKTAIKVPGSRNTIIRNCTFKNYSIGVEYTYKTKIQYSRVFYIPSLNNLLENSIFYNNNNAIYVDNHGTGSIIENIHNNIFLENNKNIYITSNKHSDARNNFWGTSNETEIENKLRPKQNIIYKPFLTNSKYLDLKINKNIKFKKTNTTEINFQIEKNKYFLNQQIKILLLDLVNNSIIKTKEINISNYIGLTKLVNLSWNLKYGHTLSIILDPENKFEEIDKSNNYLTIEYKKKQNLFLKINSGIKVADIEIRNYLETEFENYNLISNDLEADLIINIQTEKEKFILFKLMDLIKPLNNLKPYEGIIKSNQNIEKHNISIIGFNLDGTITGIKEFIKSKQKYIKTTQRDYINSTNLNGLKIYDTLHLSDNKIYYKKNNNLFAKKIRDILYGNNVKISKYLVPISISSNQTHIDYNLIKISGDYSNKLKKQIDKDRLPIVFSGGLWGNIKTWQELGLELANQGFEVYLIELTGSKQLECLNCYNYNYSFLTKKVLPSYINFIKTDANKNKIKYIGHSNGARTILDSLSNSEINQNEIETLIAVGVPGSFSEKSYFSDLIGKGGNNSLNYFKHLNITHVTLGEIAEHLDFWASDLTRFLNSENKISTNLFKQYYTWVISKNDTQPGKNLNLENFILLAGKPIYFYNSIGKRLNLINNDVIVSLQDEREIFSQIQAKNKYYQEFNSLHIGMSENQEIKETIKTILNKNLFKK